MLCKDSIIMTFTDLAHIVSLSGRYIMWLVVFPFVICIALVYEGVYIGSTYTVPIRNSMIFSLAVFVSIYYAIVPQLGNHGLWLAFILFSLGRSTVLFLYRKKMLNKVFILESH
jgi:MATE family multidrug resistance protein